MAKIILGGIIFANQEDAKSYLNNKMASYEIDTPIPDAEIPLWFEVLQKHEWFDEYVTHGIHSFAATRSEKRPNLRNMVVVNDQREQKPFSMLYGLPIPSFPTQSQRWNLVANKWDGPIGKSGSWFRPKCSSPTIFGGVFELSVVLLGRVPHAAYLLALPERASLQSGVVGNSPRHLDF